MKLIASDYDGTLNKNGIPDHVRAAILSWQDAGNRFGIVSGRGLQNLLGVVKRDVLSCDYLIANNGAVVADGEGNVLLYATGEPSLSREIASYILAEGGRYACVENTVKGLFVCREGDKTGRWAEDDRFLTLTAYTDPIAFTQISTVCESNDAAAGLTEKINGVFAESVNAFQNGICIDIVPTGIDKAVGIARLAALWEISYGDICSVGDNYNDVAMLKAYRSYAVVNAVDYVKSIADTVVADIGELIEREFAL